LREPLGIAGLEEVSRHDEEILDVAGNDGVNAALAGVELGEIREVCDRELSGQVHVADRLRLGVVVCKRPDDRHDDQED